MRVLKPKEQHERLLADADKEKIVQYLADGQNQEITLVAVALARQCSLFVHFRRLWMLRVVELDKQLSTDAYMQNVFINRRTLHKELSKTSSS